MAVVVAPEGVGLGALAINFLLLCLAVVLAGMIGFSNLFVQAVHFIVAHTIGALPLVGFLVNDITGPVFRAVERGLSDAFLGVQGSIGFYWRGCATIANWLAREVRSHAHLLLLMAESTLPIGWAYIAYQEFGRLRHMLDLLGRGIDRTAGRLETLVESLPSRIDARIAPRLRAIDHTIDHVLYPDIAGLRARTRTIVDELGRLGERLRRVEKLLGTAAFAEAVAVALAALGVSWIRCRNWKRIGKGVCGLPYQLIEDLLGLAFAFEVVVDPVTLAEAALATEDALQDIIDKIAA